MYKTSLGSVTAEIEALLAEKYSAKGRDLQHKIRSAGRNLPPSVRAQARYLVEAQRRTANPKRAHQYDPERVVRAWKHCVSHLEKVDPAARRRLRRLGWFTSVLVNMFLLAVLFAMAVAYLG